MYTSSITNNNSNPITTEYKILCVLLDNRNKNLTRRSTKTAFGVVFLVSEGKKKNKKNKLYTGNLKWQAINTVHIIQVRKYARYTNLLRKSQTKYATNTIINQSIVLITQ